MPFDPQAYGPEVAKLLGLDGDGQRLLPLVCDGSASRLSGLICADLFQNARHPRGAHAGLWLYFSCFDASHEIAQEDKSVEGSYWHAILHRQEPDDFNAGYWFGRVGQHAIYPQLARDAAEIASRYPGCGLQLKPTGWDPQSFVAYCALARTRAGSVQEQVALEVQRAEWQLLFDHCASSSSDLPAVSPAILKD